MGRNGRDSDSPEELRREAAERLASIKRTAAALEDRLRERTDQITEVVDRTVTGLHEADKLLHKYRYVLIGGAVGLGFVMARRSRERVIGGNGTRYVVVEPARRSGVMRSVAGSLFALALRQGLSWLLRRLDEPREPAEPRLFPAAKPRI